MANIIDKAFHWLKSTAIPWYTSLGLTKGTVTLEVPGRHSGKLIRVSLTTVGHAGSRYLVCLYDQSQWLKNVRAAHGQVTIFY